MEKYCKILLVVTALIFAGGSVMQAQERPVLIVKGGFNVSNLSMSKKSFHIDPDPKIGYNIGATVDIPAFMKSMFVRTGVGLTSKGAELDEWDTDFKSNLVYIQVPVNVGYRFNFGLSDIALVTSGGTYFAYGVGGKTKLDGARADSFDVYKRFDFGLNADVSIEYKCFVGGFDFSYGVLNINKELYLIDSGRKMDVNNVNCSFYVGYKF